MYMDKSVGSNKVSDEEVAQAKAINSFMKYGDDWGPDQDDQLIKDLKPFCRTFRRGRRYATRSIPYTIASKRNRGGIPPVHEYRSIRNWIGVLRRRYLAFVHFLTTPDVVYNPQICVVITNHAYYYRDVPETPLENYFCTNGLDGYHILRRFFTVNSHTFS